MSTLLRKHRTLLGLSLISSSGLFLALRSMSSSFASASKTASPQSSQDNYPLVKYSPRHTKWPYKPSDFARQDSSSDLSFYNSPRFVTHIDDAAISALRAYYSSVLPRRGKILDLCSSWISHYPPEIEEATEKQELEIVGVGMNVAELKENRVLQRPGSVAIVDLNEQPKLGPQAVGEGETLDATTCVVSIDYLTEPVAVLSSIREHTKCGGSVHLVISNRCFPTKAVARWLRVDEDERLRMVGDYLWFSGWRDIEILTLSDRESQGGDGWFAMLRGMNHPLWVVRGSKVSEEQG